MLCNCTSFKLASVKRCQKSFFIKIPKLSNKVPNFVRKYLPKHVTLFNTINYIKMLIFVYSFVLKEHTLFPPHPNGLRSYVQQEMSLYIYLDNSLVNKRKNLF